MKPLRSTRNDWIAVAALSTITALAVTTVWATSEHRSSSLDTSLSAEQPAEIKAPIPQLPDTLSERYELSDNAIAAAYKPTIIDGVLLTSTNDDSSSEVTAFNPDNAEQLWTYTRALPLCSLSTAFQNAYPTYLSNSGCGDTVGIRARSGTYAATRSALASRDVIPISSNSAVGTVSTQRVELWRSDLVRTVEYGQVDAPAEPNLQPHPGCTIDSALTRTDLLAVVERCDGRTQLTFQKSVPEEFRTPELNEDATVELPEGSHLVAVAQHGAAIWSPKDHSVHAYDDSGALLSSIPVAEKSPSSAAGKDLPFAPMVADLPYHIAWFDGSALHLLKPEDLSLGHTFDDAIGTPVAIGEDVAYPTASGIRIVDWRSGETKQNIEVDRKGYAGPVGLGLAASTLIEKRGDVVVGLSG